MNIEINNNLPYITLEKSEEQSFYIVPKQIFKDERFKGLTSDAILLYSILKDRVSLSRKNKWVNPDGHVYIIYKREQVMDEIGWGKNKVVDKFKELNKYGLIKEERQGIQQPNLIYVKSYYKQCEEPQPEEPQPEDPLPKDPLPQEQKEGSNTDEIEEVWKSNHQRFENQTSRGLEINIQEVLKPNPINTNNTNTNNININQSISPTGNYKLIEMDGWMDSNQSKDQVTYEQLESLIKHNINYEFLIDQQGIGYNVVEDIVSVIMDVLYSSQKTLSIGEEKKPIQLIKSRFFKIDQETTEYVIHKLKNNTHVTNMQGWLTTTLYNASLSSKAYWSNHASCTANGLNEV